MVPMGPIFMQATAMINCKDNHLKAQYKKNILETLSFLFLWLQPWGKVLMHTDLKNNRTTIKKYLEGGGIRLRKGSTRESNSTCKHSYTYTRKHTPHTPCQPLSHICPPQAQANTEQSVSTYTLTLRIGPESRKHVKDHLQYSRPTPELFDKQMRPVMHI